MIAKGRYAAAVVALAASATLAQPAAAQREIVQPLPAEGERRLSDALSRLARDTTDVDAVLDAGEAALELNDIDAAIGFFGRANELSPGNSRTKLGLARAYLRSRRPVEALRLFAEAEKAGVSEARMAEDRGLAFDLVGDAASAQELYRLALANGAGEETVRRLALSQAIAGDREEFEATLLPLLEKGDVAAFRTRAFGLAILGNPAEAKQIANTMLPAGLGARMAAYFDYMPRLTQAQQAAAGNLGIFPRTASIGTDDARIAGYERTARRSAPAPTPSAVRIAPAAPEVDPRASQARRRPDLTGSSASVPAPSTAPETLMASERAESSAEAPTPTPVSSNPTPVPTIATTLDVAAQTPSPAASRPLRRGRLPPYRQRRWRKKTRRVRLPMRSTGSRLLPLRRRHLRAARWTSRVSPSRAKKPNPSLHRRLRTPHGIGYRWPPARIAMRLNSTGGGSRARPRACSMGRGPLLPPGWKQTACCRAPTIARPRRVK